MECWTKSVLSPSGSLTRIFFIEFRLDYRTFRLIYYQGLGIFIGRTGSFSHFLLPSLPSLSPSLFPSLISPFSPLSNVSLRSRPPTPLSLPPLPFLLFPSLSYILSFRFPLELGPEIQVRGMGKDSKLPTHRQKILGPQLLSVLSNITA